MAIEKSLYQAPIGLDSLGAEPDIEIEIEDPESVRIGMGDIEIEIEKGKEADSFDDNLAEYIDDDVLSSLAADLISEFDEDISSRKDWMQTYVDGLDLLGMKIEERAEPWEGACGVYHPLLSEALVKFQAETIMETFPAAGPVKTQIIGKDTPEKAEAAIRVRDDMNYQLTEKMVEYRPEHERMLWGLGLSGNAFKKVYFDPSLNRQVSIFVPAEDLVVPYGASNLETAERVTHVMRKSENELRKLQVAGFYRDVDMEEPTNTMDEVEKKIAEKMGFRATTDDRYKLLEMQVFLDLEGFEDRDEDDEETGIALPYIVTIEKGTQTVLAIRRNWHPEPDRDEKKEPEIAPNVVLKEKRSHFVHYGYIPGFGFYCFGLIHLLGAFAKSGTSILRQLVDAGTLANLPGGLKSKGMRVKGDDTPISPGEFRDVDVASGTIRDNILPLPYKEPSQVLLALMNQIVEEGRRFASAADMKVSDMSANSPVGTTLAILERTLKVMSAVQARIHYSMKQEFRLLRDIIRDYTPESYTYEPEEGSPKAKRSDYDMVEVIPVSDPNAATMSQKVVQYQAVMQMAQQAPQIYDLPELHRQMLEVLGIKNIGKLVPTEDDEKPKDPISENMAMLSGKPLKAFIYQDQEAHITAHMAFLQDPATAQMIGQNPMAQQMAASMQAHVAEHFGFLYRQKIEQELGGPLPKPGEEMPEEVELQVSRLVAKAATQLTQKNQQQAAQQQAQQQQQDPIIQMQMQELQIKAKEADTKDQKAQADAALRTAQLELEKERIASTERIVAAQIASKEEIEGAKIGVDVGKQKDDRERFELQQEAQGIQMGMQMGEKLFGQKPKGSSNKPEPEGE